MAAERNTPARLRVANWWMLRCEADNARTGNLRERKARTDARLMDRRQRIAERRLFRHNPRRQATV